MSSIFENVSDEGNIRSSFDPEILERESPLSVLYFLSGVSISTPAFCTLRR